MKKIISLLLLCTMLIAAVPSYAEGTVTFNKPEVVQATDSVSGLVTQALKVSGTGGEAYSRKVVTIGVIRKGLDSSVAANYTLFDQCIMTQAGSFEKEMPFDNSAGTYIVRISVQELSTPWEAQIVIPEISGINDFVTKYRNGSYDKASLLKEILTSGEKLSIDLTVFKQLSQEKQLEICEKVLDGEKKLLFEEIKEKIDAVTALLSVTDNENTDAVYNALSYYNSKYYQFGEDTEWKIFQNGTSSFRESILKTLGEGSYADYAAVKKALYESIAVKDFADVSIASDLKEKITVYQSRLDHDDYKAYEQFSSSKKNNVATYLYKQKNNFTDMNKVAEAFGYVIDNYDTLFPASKPGGGTGNTGSRPSGGNQTVQMPSDINQEPTPTQVAKPVETTLTDLGSVAWAEEAIMTLFREGIISGKGNGLFKPEDSITRGEFIKILTGACGVSTDGGNISFSDVPESHWAYDYVAGGFSNGIVRGVSETEFGVDNQITREDMCTMAYRVISLKGQMTTVENPEAKFTDMDTVSDYAVYSVQMLSSYQLISGYPDGSFAPKAMVTRAEAAYLAHTLAQYLKGGK